jgi:choline-glycine betaine transporter
MIVYLGAIIILIGYICAIRPNINLIPTFNLIPLLNILFYFILFVPNSSSQLNTNINYIDFFYNFSGYYIFILLIFILFFILIIVTSQYSCPKGPFRTIS